VLWRDGAIRLLVWNHGLFSFEIAVKVLIFGAGAIGLYVGGSLAEAGHTVTFVARPQVAEAIRGAGVRLIEKPTERTIRVVSATTSPAEALAAGLHDVVVFAIKSYDTAAALAQLREATTAPPPCLCLQNGVDNEPEIARLFGADRVIAGTVTTAVSKSGAAAITVERKRGVGIALGHPLSSQIVEALTGAGLKARAYLAPAPMKWSKLLTNLIGSATSAILDMRVAEVFADRRLFEVEAAALRECLAVMRSLNFAPVDLPGTPVRALAFAVERLPAWLAQPLLRGGAGAGRGSKMPSFHMDLHSGKGATEVRWLHGAVARYGAKCGVPAPVNQRLTDTLEALSTGTLRQEDFRRQPGALLRLINA
jgi:2-dehydropantoate 2-reductase